MGRWTVYTRKRVVVVAGISALLLLAAFTAVAISYLGLSDVPQAAASTTASSAPSAVPAQDEVFKSLGLMLRPATASGKRSESDVIAIARTVPMASRATSASAQFVLATSDVVNGAPTSKSVVNQPTWVVTLDGLHISRSGGAYIPGANNSERPKSASSEHHQLIVFIDDATGEILQMTTYR